MECTVSEVSRGYAQPMLAGALMIEYPVNMCWLESPCGRLPCGGLLYGGLL